MLTENVDVVVGEVVFTNECWCEGDAKLSAEHECCVIVGVNVKCSGWCTLSDDDVLRGCLSRECGNDFV